MAADGIKIKINCDIRGAEKAMEKLEAQVSKLQKAERKVGHMENNYKRLGDEAKRAYAEAEKALKEYQAAEEKANRRGQFLDQRTLAKNPGATQEDLDRAAAMDSTLYNLTGAAETARERYAQLAAEAERLTRKHESLAGKLEQAKAGLAAERQATRELQEEINRTDFVVDRFKNVFQGIGNALAAPFRGAKADIVGVVETMKEKITAAFAAIRDKAQYAFSHPLHTIFGAVKKVFVATASAIVGAAKRIPGALAKVAQAAKSLFKSTSKTNGSFASGVRTLLKYSLGIRSLYILFNKLRSALVDGFKNLAQFSTETNASISMVKSALIQLKNSFATAFAPILTVVAPILTRFINLLSSAANSVARLTAMLTGQKSYTKAVAVQEDYAASLNDTADAAENTAGSLAGFDEINQLAADSSSAAGGSGEVSPSEMFEEVAVEPLAFDSWGEAFSSMLSGILDDGIPRLEEGLTAFAGWINVFSANLAEMFKFPGVYEQVAAIGTNLAAVLNNFVSAVNWGDVGTALGAGLNLALALLVSFLYAFDWLGLGARFAELVNSAVAEIDWYALGQFLWTKFKIALETLAGLLLNLDMAQLAQAASNIVIGFFDSMAETVQNIDWTALGEQVKDFLVNIDWAAVARSVFTAIGTAFGAAAAFLWGLIHDAWEQVINWWHDAAYKDGEFTVEGLLDGIQNVMKNIGTWIKEHIFDPFIEGFKSVFGIHSPSTVMAEMGGYLIDGLKNGLTGLWGKVKGFFTEALDGIKKTFSLSALKSIGVNAVTGLMNGLKSVGSKVTSWAKGILSNIKDTLGIHSPSKETEDLGEYTVAGYINGLNAYGNKLRQAVSDMAESTLSTLAKGTEPSLEMPVEIAKLSANAARVKLAEPAYATGRILPAKSAVAATSASAANAPAPGASFSTIKQALLEALQEAGGLGNGGDIHITVELDGKVVARNTVRHINDMTIRAGKPVLLI